MRIITNAISLRQQPFQPFTPSPSGSLLPNTIPPTASSVASLKQQQQQPPNEPKSLQELQEERRQKIRKYVYISQGALILIIALIWLASNFVSLKTPNSIFNSTGDSSEAVSTGNRIVLEHEHGGVAVDSVTNTPPSIQNATDLQTKDGGSSKEMREETVFPEKGIEDNNIVEEDGDRKTTVNDVMKMRKRTSVEVTDDAPKGDEHKIRKRWMNFLRSHLRLI